MTGYRVVVAVLVLAICGCKAAHQEPEKASPPPVQSETPAVHRVQIEGVSEPEHLGHNIVEGQRHTVWCDGYRARIVGTGEPFVVYWINTRIEDSPFQLKPGGRYAVSFTGEQQTGVMGYAGACIDLQQVVKVEAMGK
jgi:hypothetical protein